MRKLHPGNILGFKVGGLGDIYQYLAVLLDVEKSTWT